MPRRSKPKSVHQLKITLREIKPAIWRRIQVPSDTTLPDLHLMLQASMGWYNCHLHLFEINEQRYGIPDPDFPDDDLDERLIALASVLPGAGARCMYLYDFGDGWEHDIDVEQVLPAQADTQYPTCLDGERACPPEDCGGPWGYEELLEIINNPAHEEHEETLRWVRGSFDTEAFDLAKADKRIKDFPAMDLSTS